MNQTTLKIISEQLQSAQGKGGDLYIYFSNSKSLTATEKPAEAAFLSLDKIATLYQSVLTDNCLQVTNSSIKITGSKEEPKEITITGKTSSFGGERLQIELSFAIRNKLVLAHLKVDLGDNGWSLGDIPWITISKPTATLLAANENTPVMGSLGGILEIDGEPINLTLQMLGESGGNIKGSGFGIDIDLPFPVTAGEITLHGSFIDDSAPSIDRCFALTGNINLVSALPEPLSAFSDLKLQEFEVCYNKQKKSVSYFKLTIGTKHSWPLLPKDIVKNGVVVKEMQLECLIENPGVTSKQTSSKKPEKQGNQSVEKAAKKREVSYNISGQFSIGKGVILVTATTKPHFVATAELIQNTIKLQELLAAFLPGDLPSGIDLHAEIKAFSMSIDPRAKSYSLNSKIDTDWTLDFGGPKLQITGLQIDVASNDGKTTGGISGDLLIGSKDEGVPLKLSAQHPKTGGGWVLSAIGEHIKLLHLADKFLQDLGGIHAIPQALNKLELSYLSVIATVPKASDQTNAEAKAKAGSKALSNKKKLVAKTATPPPSKDTTSYDIEGDVVWPLDIDGHKLEFDAQVKLRRDNKGNTTGTIAGEATLFGIKLLLGYEFTSDHKKILFVQWQGFRGSYDEDSHLITVKMGKASLGQIISGMMHTIEPGFSLPPPWDILNDIDFDGLSFSYNTKSHAWTVEYTHPIDLGFAKLNSLTLTKHPGDDEHNKDKLNSNGKPKDKKSKKAQVRLAATGSILGRSLDQFNFGGSGPDKGNDVQDMPPVPGLGSKLFDLQYLGLGQHVSLKQAELDKIDSVKDALKAYQAAFAKPGEVDSAPLSDGLHFDKSSSWLIGTQFVVMDTVDMGIIFNDPNLYGLLIRLHGEKAKLFAGLEFQILYKKVNEKIGVYEIELKLPDVMRHMEFGEVSVTLPVIGVQIYTNGNFRIDIGFPAHNNFARSFQIEAFPFTGAGGFYFAALNGATSKRVPKITSGTFSPVIEFGIGVQLGLGKNMDEGIMKAGISVTMQGIMEGVIGFYHAKETEPKSGDNYYYLKGTAALVGHVYGCIDFAIIKARLDVMVYARLGIVIESFQAIPITLDAGISLQLSVEIDLGIFSITIHLSFGYHIHQSFSIGHQTPENALPWKLASPHAEESASKRAMSMAPHMKGGIDNLNMMAPSQANPPTLHWAPINTHSPSKLELHFVPSASIAQKENTQSVEHVYTAMLFIETPQPISDELDKQGGTANQPVPNNDTTSPPIKQTAFLTLAKGIFVWAIHSHENAQKSSNNYETLLTEQVSAQTLNDILLALSVGEGQSIPSKGITAFLQNFFADGVHIKNYDPEKSIEPMSCTVFPMLPSLALEVKASYDKNKQTKYLHPKQAFSEHLNISSEQQRKLSRYFDNLMLSYQSEVEEGEDQKEKDGKINDRNIVADNIDSESESMAAFVYQDYFTLLVKASIQDAINHMKMWSYTVDEGQTIEAIANEFNQTPVDVANANKTTKLYDKQTENLFFIDGESTISNGNDSLNNIAITHSVSATQILIANRTVKGLLKPGITIRLTHSDKKATHTITSSDTIQSLANEFTDILTLLTKTNLADEHTLFLSGKKLILSRVRYQIQQKDTLNHIVGYFGLRHNTPTATTALIRFMSENALVPNMFIIGSELKTPSGPYKIEATDTILSLAKRFDANNEDGIAPLSKLIADLAILQVFTPIHVPEIYHTITKGESFASLAATYDISIASIADDNAKRQVFPTQSKISITDIKNIPLSKLVEQIEHSHGFAKHGGMAARFLLHGLRLPDPREIPDDASKPVWKTSTELVNTSASLYKWTGQTFSVPIDEGLTQISVALTDQSKWVQMLSDTHLDDVPSTVIKKQRIVQAGLDLTIQINELAPMQKYYEVGKHFNFVHHIPWQLENPLAYVHNTKANTQEVPWLWQFPESLLKQLMLPKVVQPKLGLHIGTRSHPNAPLTTSPVNNYSWSLSVNLQVSQIPVAGGSKMMPNTYELVGTDEVGEILLERLIEHLNVPSDQQGDDHTTINDVVIAYRPNPSEQDSGLRSHNGGDNKTFLVRSNLATESQSQITGQSMLTQPDSSLTPQSLNTPPQDFIELVWEASVIHSGGTYLYYEVGTDHSGLPSGLFNDKHTADLTLVVTFTNSNNVLENYMNGVVVGDNVDVSNSILFGAAQTQAFNFEFSHRDSLSSIAKEHNLLVDDLAHQVKDIPIVVSMLNLELRDVLYQVPPGDTNESIVKKVKAKYQLTDAEATTLEKTLSVEQTTADSGLLGDEVAWILIRLPDRLVSVDVSSTNSSLAKAAKEYHISLASLANANRDLPGLFANPVDKPKVLKLSDFPIDRVSVFPPGNIGFSLQRPALDSKDKSTYLDNLFNLLGYRVIDNQDFTASGEGLPVGHLDPMTPDPLTGQLVKHSDSDHWNYSRVIPIASFAKITRFKPDAKYLIPAINKLKKDPYCGVGKIAQIAFAWHDMFGNRAPSPASFPNSNGTEEFPNYLALKVRYFDEIMAIEQWPGIGANYFVEKQGEDDPQLQVVLSFNANRYFVYEPLHPDTLVDKTAKHPVTKQMRYEKELERAQNKVRTDMLIYQKIYYQINQPDFEIVFESSLDEIPHNIDKDVLSKLVRDIYLFLTKLLNHKVKLESYTLKKGDVVVKEKKDDDFSTAQKLAKKLGVGVVLNDLILVNRGLKKPFQFQSSDEESYKLLLPGFEESEKTKEDSSPVKLDRPQPTVLTARNISIPNSVDIFPLEVKLSFKRDPALVDENFLDAPGVALTTSTIAPLNESKNSLLENFNNNKDINSTGKLSLSEFAKLFEDAFNHSHGKLKIATGLSKHDVVNNNSKGRIWVVRMANKQKVQDPEIDNKHTLGIHYQLAPEAVYYSPTPLATNLLNFSGDKIPSLKKYQTGVGLTGKLQKTFTGVDIDTWGRIFLDAIGQFLTPTFLVPSHTLNQHQFNGTLKKYNAAMKKYEGSKDLNDKPKDKEMPKDYLEMILTAKETLADAIVASEHFDQILTHPSINEDAYANASAIMRQQLLNHLSNAYSIDSVVQYATNNISLKLPESKTATAPKLYGKLYSYDKKNPKSDDGEFTLSTAKLPLSAPHSDLTFVVDAKKEKQQKDLPLSLRYQITHIEHEIEPIKVKLNGKVQTYDSSTWLNFVLPLDPVEVGDADIPVPLRTYPTPPSLVSQSGIASTKTTTASAQDKRDEPHTKESAEAALRDMLKWTYSYTYSQIEAAQDSIHTEVLFNQPDQVNPYDTKLSSELPPKDKLFFSLAQFVNAYPALEQDLVTLVAGVTTKSKPKVLKHAAIALKTFATLVDEIATDWQKWEQPKRIKPGDRGFAFTVTERSFSEEDDQGTKNNLLAVELRSPTQSPFPLPNEDSIKIEGYHTKPIDNIDPTQATEPDTTIQSFKFLSIEGNKPLSYSEGRRKKERQILVPKLNVLKFQKAWAGVAIRRNDDLVRNNPTNEPFLYQTPLVRDVNSLVPYIDSNQRLDISLLGAVSNVPRTLTENLMALFDQLFVELPQDTTPSLKIDASFAYSLQKGVDSPFITLPIFIVPTTPITTNTKRAYIENLSNTLHRWYSETHPGGHKQEFQFDISIYTDPKHSQLPLARLRGFHLPLGEVDKSNVSDL